MNELFPGPPSRTSKRVGSREGPSRVSPIFEFEPSAPTFSTVSGLSILLRHGCLGAEQKPAGQFFESRDVREDRINRMKRVPSDISALMLLGSPIWVQYCAQRGHISANEQSQQQEHARSSLSCSCCWDCTETSLVLTLVP